MTEPRAKREPSADQRMMARGLHGIFTALIDEGFTEQQAISIIGVMIATVPRSDPDG